TLSFNLAPGVSLGEATKAIDQAEQEIGLPNSIHTSFQGTAAAFRNSLSSEPILILASIITVYIVLGVLYESYIHPITIISTLPSAGVGAILALLLCRTEFSVIALIGIILLIGIVKKNAIMMIDFALEAERKEGKAPLDAIYEACLLRFRPIMMTTMAALLGGLPLALGAGVGSELRRPLGITIAGVTQMTSSSGLGNTGITLQFDLNRDINAAARDVQAAINAARSQLPADLPGQPTYRKANPADAPILMFSLTSDNIPPAQIYDAADSVLAQKIAQVEGVGQVFTWGSARPAVRVETNPYQLNSYGISLETVRKSLQAANANLAKGALSDSKQTWAVSDTDQLFKAYEYQPLTVAGPLSLIGTFGVMYLGRYSLDNLSLMALTISTGFVVDDAIVVIENITRHIEGGMKPYEAAMKGASEIGFTVLSMSTSLVA